MRDLVFRSARELVTLIRRREVSAVEVMEAHLAQIARVNPSVNAIVHLDAAEALAAASEADRRSAEGSPLGPLHGLPVAHKDLFDTVGMRTTQGSPLFADHVPTRDALIVERLRRAGAIRIGKTNTPEFGAGSQTFNPVYGVTRNPYDLSLTCGGSSGGAAVALACGMVPIADGSDIGGSLRNPAAFCNVVGLRPSPGRVPVRDGIPWNPLGVHGPMARNVGDVALMLSAIAGPEPGIPLSLAEEGDTFAPPLARDLRGMRIAWSPRLGGLPVEPAVLAVVEAQRTLFERLGCEIEEVDPDLSGADEAFMVLRAWAMQAKLGALVRGHPEMVKDTVRWNVAEGERLSGAAVAQAMLAQGVLIRRMASFFERYHVLLCATTQVAPFPVEVEYPASVAGVQMHSYIEWMRSCYLVTMTAGAAISVPAGFTVEGLPVGLQIVGPYREERRVLEVAAAFERLAGAGQRRPAIAVGEGA